LIHFFSLSLQKTLEVTSVNQLSVRVMQLNFLAYWSKIVGKTL